MTSNEGVCDPVSVPGGQTQLVITPPLGSVLKPHSETHVIAGDEDMVIQLLPPPETARLILHIDGSGEAPANLRAVLMGETTISADALDGKATWDEVQTGRYSVYVQLPGGLLGPLGPIDVEGPQTVVRRSLAELRTVSVAPDGYSEGGTLVARLTHAATGRVLGRTPVEGGAAEWLVPAGEYDVELIATSARGQVTTHARRTSDAETVKVGLKDPAATMALSFKTEEAVDVATVEVRVVGPITRIWELPVRLERGVGQFRATGLPEGRYQATVTVRGASGTSVLVDLLAGDAVEVPMVTLR